MQASLAAIQVAKENRNRRDEKERNRNKWKLQRLGSKNYTGNDSHTEFMLQYGKNTKKKKLLSLYPQHLLIDQIYFKDRKKPIKKKRIKEFYDSDDERAQVKKKGKTWIVYDEFFRSEDFVLTMQPEKIGDDDNQSSSSASSNESDLDFGKSSVKKKFHDLQSVCIKQ